MSASFKPLLIAGPSGVGKGTLIEKVLQRFPQSFELSVSHTTRQQRPNEIHGLHYFFVSRDEFEHMIRNNQFLEHAIINGNYYGTSRAEFIRIPKLNKIALLELDLQGIQQILESPLGSSLHYIFIRPPSIEILRSRLKHRCTEQNDEINSRIKLAEQEICQAQTMPFHFYLENDDLDDAVQKLVSHIQAVYKELQSI